MKNALNIWLQAWGCCHRSCRARSLPAKCDLFTSFVSLRFTFKSSESRFYQWGGSLSFGWIWLCCESAFTKWSLFNLFYWLKQRSWVSLSFQLPALMSALLKSQLGWSHIAGQSHRNQILFVHIHTFSGQSKQSLRHEIRFSVGQF